MRKKDILQRAYAEYEFMKNNKNAFSLYDAWMNRGLNNARLASVATYYDYVSEFNALLRQVDYDLQSFYREVKSIASMTEQERAQRMQMLKPVMKASVR